MEGEYGTTRHLQGRRCALPTITKLNFPLIPDIDILNNDPPKISDAGITLLNKSLRDLTGTLIETNHLLTY